MVDLQGVDVEVEGIRVTTHLIQVESGTAQAEGLTLLGAGQTTVEVQGLLVSGEGPVELSCLLQDDGGVIQAVGLVLFCVGKSAIEVQGLREGLDRILHVPGLGQQIRVMKSLLSFPEYLLLGGFWCTWFRHYRFLSVVGGRVLSRGVLVRASSGHR